ELRMYLRQKLPEYMLPSAIVRLEGMPLSANGKIDRRKLAGVEGVIEESEERKERARTQVEEVVAGIWSEVLRAGQIGIDDNFFELGGHSLLATQVISRVRNIFAIDIALKAFFEEPTIRGLSARVDAALREGDFSQAPAIERAERNGDLPLSFAQ